MEQPIDNKNVNYASNIKMALSSVRFPATKDELIRNQGTTRLDVAQGKTVSVREALEPIRKDRFDTPESLLNEINTAHHLGWPVQ